MAISRRLSFDQNRTRALPEFDFDAKITTQKAGVLFGRRLQGGTERSVVETRSLLPNRTTADWGVIFASNDKILEIKTQSFRYNIIGWECLLLRLR